MGRAARSRCPCVTESAGEFGLASVLSHLPPPSSRFQLQVSGEVLSVFYVHRVASLPSRPHPLHHRHSLAASKLGQTGKVLRTLSKSVS